MKILHTADLHLGVTLYGNLNRETGINTRIEDFVNSFNQVTDYAINNNVDLFIFAGDVYKTRYPSPLQEKLFAECIYKLHRNEIPTYIVLGNHDLRFQEDGAHTISIIEELKTPFIKVVAKPSAELFVSKGGEQVYLINVPYQNYKSLKLKSNIEVSTVVSESIREILSSLPKDKPIIITTHFTVDSSKIRNIEVDSSSEMWSNEPVLSLESFDGADYVALGHIHKHQAWKRNNTVIAYSGSVDRSDFNELEERGFLVYDTNTKLLQRIKIDCRNFVDIRTDLTESKNIIDDLRNNIQGKIKKGDVVRNIVNINAEDRLLVNLQSVSDLLKDTTSAGFEIVVKKENLLNEKEKQSTKGVDLTVLFEHWLNDRKEFVTYRNELLKKIEELKT